MPVNINFRILSQEYQGLFSYLIMKGVITHNYSTHEWKLSDYYKEKIPALADYDFFIYDKMLYRDMMSAERMPNIALHKAISVVDILCKSELLYKYIKPYLKKSDICWNCGKEPIIDKKNHNLFQNGKTPICIDCYNRFERITDFDNTNSYNTDNTNSCYIATMAYQDIDHPQVQFLRGFRDKYLNSSKAGRYFIKLYYQYSPFLVDKLKYQNSIHLLVKKLLDGLIFILRKISR